MYAVDNLSDAIDVARDFLTPVDARTWLKLSVVVLFLSGLSFSPPSVPGAETSTTPGTGPMPEDPFLETPAGEPVSTDVLIQVAIVLAAVALLVWLVFALIGALMEFVLIDALRTGTVVVRARMGEHVGKGLSLFGFKLVLGLIAAAVVAIPAYLLLAPIDSIEASLDGLTLADVGGLFALAGLVGLVYALVMRLTTDFVVPVMLLEDRGIRGGWRRFWATLRRHPLEYVVYVVLATIVSLVASIAITLLAAIALFVLAIPFVVLVFVAILTGPLAPVLLGVLALAAIATVLLVMALFRMPVVVYIRYYALLVLGDTEPDLDLIPSRREAVRAGTDWDGDGDWGDRPGGGRGGGPDDGWGSDDGDETDRDSSGSDWAGPADDGSERGDTGRQSGPGAEDDESSDWGYRDE